MKTNEELQNAIFDILVDIPVIPGKGTLSEPARKLLVLIEGEQKAAYDEGFDKAYSSGFDVGSWPTK